MGERRSLSSYYTVTTELRAWGRVNGQVNSHLDEVPVITNI